jgi:5'-3' exonuclease
MIFYKPYKSDRGKDFINGTHPIDELSQRKILWEYINEMYIRQLKHEIIEGDDFIAYYCLTKENEKITICTNDTDMAQLINEDVKIYYLHLKNYVDNVNYSSYFSHHQSNALLVKSIIDTADSIKGIRVWVNQHY